MLRVKIEKKIEDIRIRKWVIVKQGKEEIRAERMRKIEESIL